MDEGPRCGLHRTFLQIRRRILLLPGHHGGGYVLAKPGIPFFAGPKSILIFTVILVEDHMGKVLTEEPHQITVIERLTGGSILGLGFTRSRAQQMRDLSQQAARKTEDWLRKQPWFDGPDTIFIFHR